MLLYLLLLSMNQNSDTSNAGRNIGVVKRIPRAGYIPRTLDGVGGVKLYDIPGVKYPTSMLSESSQRKQGRTLLLNKAPSWSISARQAAAILGCLPSSARDLLHRANVRYCRVYDGTCPPRTYWDRNRVKSLARQRRPVINHKSPRLLTAGEAVAILGVSRNTLSRFVRSGMLQQFRLRVRGESGARLGCFYLREEVEKLYMHRSALGRVRTAPRRRIRGVCFLGCPPTDKPTNSTVL